jgi:alpha-beta hydrolase superfamily lysophospholipase
VKLWHPDFLDGYESTDLPLPDVRPAAGEPADVEMVATLVRRTPAERHRRAVLYVHGWNDYFFQTHLADHLTDIGFDFYAIDLRRYGRSLRRGHLRGFITDLDDYGLELGAAADVIAEDHDQLVLMGHSTGGLITSLWAGKNSGRIDGLILNAPWLDLQGLAMVRTLGSPVIEALGGRLPTSVLRLPESGFTARALHSSMGGEWDYDLHLKTASAPIRVGWLRAILLGHQRVAAGLHIEPPILVLASSASELARRWHEGLRTVDTVLDVDKITRRATQLGRCVTIVRVDEALHDVILSAPNVRKVAMDEISRWIDGYVQHPQ